MAIQFDHTANGLVTITTTNAASPSPYTLRLPDGTGSNGQVLTTDGTGNLSFATAVTTYDGLTTKPAVNVIFTGDVTGAGNVLLANTANNNLSIALTIAANSVALGTDTTGNYTNRVVGGTGISATGTADEGNVITVGLATSGVTAGTYGNANVVSQITVDAQGRVTAASNVAINKVFNLISGNTITACGMTQHTAINTNTFNFFAGQCAGNAITTGENNIFLGCSAGCNNTSGSDNSFFGLRAGCSITTGSKNFFAGACAGANVITGNNNIILGCLALNDGFTESTSNVILFATGGEKRFFIDGSTNIALGTCAGRNTQGKATFGNFFAGFRAGDANTEGYNNTFIGNRSGRDNVTGCNNIFIGSCAGYKHEWGNYNTVLGAYSGSSSLLCDGRGYYNTTVGAFSGRSITSGTRNAFFGPQTGNGVSTGNRNLFLGWCAGGNVQTGNDNIVFGNITNNVGLTTDTSNTIIFATGGVIRYCNNAPLGNTTITGNVIATNTFFGSGAGLTGIVLGTNTSGNYVASVSAGLGVTVTGGTGVGSTPTIAANVRSVGSFTGDVSNAQLLSSILQVDGAGSNLDADLLDGQNGTYYLDYTNITQKPAANITLTGDVTGSVSNVLQANSTVLSLATTLANSGVTAASYGNANVVPQITVDAKGRVTAASNVVIDRNYGTVTNKPSVNVTFTGDVTGAGNVLLANTANNNLSIALTIAANSVALGTDTTGNYVANVIAGAGIVASGGGSETSTVTISHLDTSSVGNVSSDTSNGVVIQDITLGFDTFGHVTGASVATVDLDSRFLRLSTTATQFVTGPVDFQGNIVFTGNVVSVTANNLIVEDNLIQLAKNNTTDALDFGFIGHYSAGNANIHAGFFRDASDSGIWKVFENYPIEPSTDTNIDTANLSYREASFKANILIGNRLDLTNIAGNSVVATGNIFTSNNLIVGQAVRTSGGGVYWHSLNDGTGSGLDADLLDGQDGSYYLNYANLVNDPAANITLTGDVTGNVSNVLQANSTVLSLATTLASTGVSASTYGNAKIVPRFTVDAKGRLTNAANTTIALDYADLVTKPSINLIFTGGATGSGNLIVGNTTTNSLSVALSLVEADTLASVTGRGATTATAVTFTNATQATSNSTGAVQVTGGLGVNGNIYGGRVIVTGTSHQANVALNSAIIGGSQNANRGANSFIGAGILNRVSLNTPAAAIVGGTNNVVEGANSVILGGGSNQITTSFDSAFLGARNAQSTLSTQIFSIGSTGGTLTTATSSGEIGSCQSSIEGTRGVVVGSCNAGIVALSENTAILGSTSAIIYKKNSVIAGGCFHDSFADNTVILGGSYGCADVRGKVIIPGHGWNIWNDYGSAQVGKQTLVNQTSTTAGSNVLINGDGAVGFTNAVGIRNNHVYVVKGTITAANATGSTKVFDYTTSAKANATGTITFVGNFGTGNAIINTIAADPGTDTWAVRFVSGKSGTEGWITANVTGNTSTIRWLLTSETSELKFA